MTNRERIAKTDICDYLTDMNDFIIHDSHCIMMVLCKSDVVICPDGIEDCHTCISAWLNEEEKDNEKDNE